MSRTFTIRQDDLSDPEVQTLLRDHLEQMHQTSPPGSVHALDVAALRAPGVTLWTAWDGAATAGRLAGCGALKQLDDQRGELKSFRTHPEHLRRGVAAALLTHLVAVALGRGYTWLGLETGSGAAFEPAHALYRRHGFQPRGPFGDYRDDPFSRFMELSLPSRDPRG